MGMTRRHFLTHVAGASALAAPGLQFLSGLKAAETKLKKENKSLIILWMGGGPSHMDLWDLKPGDQNGGEFKPIKTKASGVEISEVLPTIADQFENLSLVRSLVTNEGSHERGTVLMNTGRQPNPVVQYPAMGAVASSLLTSKDLPLPGFIGVGGTAQRIGPGFLGMMYAPFTVQNAGQPPQNVSPPGSHLGTGDEMEERLRRRERLFNTLEDDFAGAGTFPTLKSPEEAEAAGSAAQAHAAVYKKGFDLSVSPLRKVFDIHTEDKKTLDLYGGEKNGFGMGCLVARKLVGEGASPRSRWTSAAGTTTPASSTPSAPATARASTRAWASWSRTWSIAAAGRTRSWCGWASSAARRASIRTRAATTGRAAGRSRWAAAAHQGRARSTVATSKETAWTCRTSPPRSATCSPRSTRAWASTPARRSATTSAGRWPSPTVNRSRVWFDLSSCP